MPRFRKTKHPLPNLPEQAQQLLIQAHIEAHEALVARERRLASDRSWRYIQSYDAGHGGLACAATYLSLP